MTRFEPTLIVTRMVIMRDASIVYDEKFHVGVNIIRGENSSGKSTIMNFLFYGLGGDLTDWSEVALLCTKVYIEVRLNGLQAVLAREIAPKRGQPMDIFGGNYEVAIAAPLGEWTRYPYARGSKESFSQALFRVLGIPEASNEVSGKITMHQVLRLLYADQLSPVESLFKYESSFDSPIMRESIGRLLCGAYEQNIYYNELKIKSLQSEFDAVAGELRSLYSILGSEVITLDLLNAQIHSVKTERETLNDVIEEAEKQVYQSPGSDELTLAAQRKAYENVQEVQNGLTLLTNERDALSLAISDSSAFINNLENKLESLKDSSVVAKYFGEVRFHSCPACYAKIEDEGGVDACHLCKAPFDVEKSRERIIAIMNDISLQIRQSKLLQENRLKRYDELLIEVPQWEEKWRAAAERLAQLRRLPSSQAKERLRDLHRQSGYMERQAEDLTKKLELVGNIDQRQRRKEEINAEIERVRNENDVLNARQENNLQRANAAISDEIRDLLKHDLRRQDAFEDPKSIQFDFAMNKIGVDGQSYFSASSRVILKSSFFVGFLIAATKVPFFRHPRFCIIDTIEDKGMELIRSHNFQLQIARLSGECRIEHQIIFGTAMIAPELDEEDYTIGKFSTRDDPTIAIQM